MSDAFSSHYWQAAARGVLAIQSCESCGRRQFYPRPHCRYCLSSSVIWMDSVGSGTLHSFAVVHRTPNADWTSQVPYVYALVDLDEGVRITVNILDAPVGLTCGDRVEIDFDERDGISVPCARLKNNNEGDPLS